jgi:hypothetical protein
MRQFLAGLLLGSLLMGGAAWAWDARRPVPASPRLDAQIIRTSPLYLSDMRGVINAEREACYMLDQGNSYKRLFLRN